MSVYALLQVKVNISAVKALFRDSYRSFYYSPGALSKHSNNKLTVVLGLKRCTSDWNLECFVNLLVCRGSFLSYEEDMAMTSRSIWVVLAVVALVSTSAWAIWDPDADSALLFNMNFETYDNAAHTATDAKAGLVGTLEDYNTVYPNVFGETSRAGLGFDGNFAAMHDNAPGAGIASSIATPNDVRLTVAS